MVLLIKSDQKPVLTVEEGDRELALLQEQMKQLGMYKRAYFSYFSYFSILICFYCLSFFLLSKTSSYIAIFFIALFFSFIIVQIVGLMHDASHQAIFKSNRANILSAQFFGVFGGLNSFHWYNKHNRHHKQPNREGADPDLGVPFSFTKKHYQNHTRKFKWSKSFQQWAYFPFCTGMLYNVHFEYTLMGPIKRYRGWISFLDVLWSMICLAVWYGLPFLFTTPGRAVFFIVTSMTIGGLYAANIFAPNHKGMPQLENNVVMSQLEQQIITTRNVKPGLINDIFYMSLNYQIEHHLFPHCPRTKYKKIAPFVKSLTERVGLPYLVESPWNSYCAIIRELSKIRDSCEED